MLRVAGCRLRFAGWSLSDYIIYNIGIAYLGLSINQSHPSPSKKRLREKRILTLFTLVVGLQINVDISSTSRISGCHTLNFLISPKSLTWEPLLFYLFLAPKFVLQGKAYNNLKQIVSLYWHQRCWKSTVRKLIVYTTG